ncbi:MAG: twin-arginine translocase TatA/TatE family subunit [Desulfatibacillaceae bacterium]|nr:twin-arginine translocase TatA/TatE family subunit [Desulfatibacillaceae bacterium]
MFGIGMPELLIILAVALIVLGPKKLPDIAKSLGKGYAEFRRATQELKDSLDIEKDIKGVRDSLDSVYDAAADASSGNTKSTPLTSSPQAGADLPADPVDAMDLPSPTPAHPGQEAGPSPQNPEPVKPVQKQDLTDRSAEKTDSAQDDSKTPSDNKAS